MNTYKQNGEYLEALARFPHMAHFLRPEQRKESKPKQDFDPRMCGVIGHYGSEGQYELVFTSAGKYYIEFAMFSLYLGQWSNRQKVFEYLKKYDRLLHFGDLAMIEDTILRFFGRKTKPRFKLNEESV